MRKIESIYIDPETAPLTFLQIVRILAVIAIFTSSLNLITYLGGLNEWNWYAALYYALGIIFSIGAAAGLWKMKWSGVLSYCGIPALAIADGLLAIGLSIYYDMTDSLPSNLGRVIAGAIWLAILWVYFKKRRLLFSPAPSNMRYAKAAYLEKPITAEPTIVPHSKAPAVEPQTIGAPPAAEPQSEAPAADIPSEIPTPPPARYCRKCGTPLLADSVYCSACGTKIIPE